MLPAEPFIEPVITIVATAANENGRPTRSADWHISDAIPWLPSSRRSTGHSNSSNDLNGDFSG